MFETPLGEGGDALVQKVVAPGREIVGATGRSWDHCDSNWIEVPQGDSDSDNGSTVPETEEDIANSVEEHLWRDLQSVVDEAMENTSAGCSRWQNQDSARVNTSEAEKEGCIARFHSESAPEKFSRTKDRAEEAKLQMQARGEYGDLDGMTFGQAGMLVSPARQSEVVPIYCDPLATLLPGQGIGGEAEVGINTAAEVSGWVKRHRYALYRGMLTIEK
ncbi:hypothetical protein F0562_014108 [Nyssa sinensis]|uniref:Uncharacterized protein n=1 Tax=Nyssa sinensis TaxID=561372 RepID=A0A5J4ZQT3_9ASTE|nr:hypothetical protein F0562_014108 [Nyssa sinensis]